MLVDAKTARHRHDPPALVSIFTLTLCAFSVTTAEFVIAGILPQVATDLSVSIPAAGQLVTAYALGMIVGGPLLTLMTVRLPRKPLIVALLGVFILGNLAAAMAPGYAILLAARAISGLVVATFFAMAVVIAASLAPAGQQASAIAKVALGFNLAMVVGAPIGTVVGQHFGWRATFLVIVACATVALMLLARLVPVRGMPGTGSVVGELRVLKSRDLQLALATTAIGNAGILMVFVYLSPWLTGMAGLPADTIPLLLLVYGIGATLGTLAGGWLSDRALMPAMIGLLGSLAGALLLFGLVGVRPIPAAIMVFLLGALAFSVVPGLQARVLATAAGAPTLGIALNASGFQIAAALSAWLGGRIIGSNLGLASLPLVGAVATIAGVFLALASWRRDRKLVP